MLKRSVLLSWFRIELVASIGFFGFDSLMEFIDFTIALAIAFQAMKSYRLAKERSLLYLNFSFLLLGAGLFLDGLANIILLINRFHRGLLFLSRFGYTISFFAQVLAYFILIFAYMQQTRAWATQIAAVFPILFLHNAFTELILIFLLVYIVAQTMINYSVNKTTNSLLVFGAFTSLVIAHVFFLLFLIEPILFLAAHFAQLLGFLLLLKMLFKLNKIQWYLENIQQDMWI